MASVYDIEYFYSFDDYEKMVREQPIGMTSYGTYNFNFYEMLFANGVKIYLFNSAKETKQFYTYCKFPSDKVPFMGKIEDINNRTIVEATNRNYDDFQSLCKELAETREYMMIFVPFFSNPADEQ